MPRSPEEGAQTATLIPFPAPLIRPDREAIRKIFETAGDHDYIEISRMTMRGLEIAETRPWSRETAQALVNGWAISFIAFGGALGFLDAAWYIAFGEDEAPRAGAAPGPSAAPHGAAEMLDGALRLGGPAVGDRGDRAVAEVEPAADTRIEQNWALMFDAEPGAMPLVKIMRTKRREIHRPATDGELAIFLRRYPSLADEIDSGIIRRCMKDADGEFLALVSDLRALERRGAQGDADASPEDEALRAEALRKLCAAPIATATGAALKLHFVLMNDHAVLPGRPSEAQRRQLVTAAHYWVQHHLTGKAMDPARQRALLEAFA